MAAGGGSARLAGPWQRLARTAGDFLDAIVPCGCAVCRMAVPPRHPPLCGLCRSRLPRVPLPTCGRCGLTRVIETAQEMGCAACLDWPAGLRAAAACLHEGAAAHLVRGLKYRGWTGLAAPMAKCMLPAARKLAGHDEPLLVPVPLSAARRRERGFNQAELLTAELAAHTGWPHGNLLIRRGAGRPFARSGKTERARRAAEAFDVAHGSPHRTADDWPVLLVDDVITTGATAGACAAVLAGAGFRCVGAVSFARTGRSLDRS